MRNRNLPDPVAAGLFFGIILSNLKMLTNEILRKITFKRFLRKTVNF